MSSLPENADARSSLDPFSLFETWLELAAKKEINDPNAMAIATTGRDGMPNVRMVLLKAADTRGFVFYTNTESNKGRELAENMQAAGVLHWKSLRRQVRFRGAVARVSDDEADAYFISRARESRLGAWASPQSRPLEGRSALRKAVARAAVRFRFGDIPRPPYWTGYRISPVSIEFWTDGAFRIHDLRTATDSTWKTKRLFP